MRRITFATIASIILSAVICLASSSQNSHAGSDMKDIPEPKERVVGYYENIFEAHFAEPIRYYTDPSRWIRKIARKPKRAANTNALDEAPDSSWYTNRHHLHRMSVPELIRGPNTGQPPDF